MARIEKFVRMDDQSRKVEVEVWIEDGYVTKIRRKTYISTDLEMKEVYNEDDYLFVYVAREEKSQLTSATFHFRGEEPRLADTARRLMQQKIV